MTSDGGALAAGSSDRLRKLANLVDGIASPDIGEAHEKGLMLD